MKNLFKKIWVFLFKRKRREEIFFEEAFFVDDLPVWLDIEKPKMMGLLLERWRNKNLPILEERILGINSFKREVLKGICLDRKTLFSFSKEKKEEKQNIQKRLKGVFLKDDIEVLNHLETQKNSILFLIACLLCSVFSWMIFYFVFSLSFSVFFYFPCVFLFFYVFCISHLLKVRQKKMQILLAKATLLDSILAKYI